MKYDLWQTKRENSNNKHYEDKNGNLAVNVFTEFINNKPIVAMFVGKALKPKYYYRFNCEMDAARFIKTRVIYELNSINEKIDKQVIKKTMLKKIL